MHPETLAIHAGRSTDPTTGAVAPPIHLSTTFLRLSDGSFPADFNYIRHNNPNRQSLETCLAALEHGAEAAAFASGMAATSAVLQALPHGSHVVAPLDGYTGTLSLLRDHAPRWGLSVTFVDMTKLDEIDHALKPATALVWIETPSNPELRLTDIQAVAERAHAVGAILACDNTWATPLGQQPFTLGADIVMHSTTKYLGGHSDVQGGALIAHDAQSEFWHTIRHLQHIGGAVPSPFDCWLILRGIQTLPYRMRGHVANAQQVAAFLAEHPAVERVHYPGLASHPQFELAQRQMLTSGGMVSFQVRGDADLARRVASSTKIWTQATSLGGVESLIEHRASVEGGQTRTPENLLRLSVGLEHPDDLLADLAQALG